MKFTKGFTPWNKGKKGVQKAWNKGKKLGFIPKMAFKKGENLDEKAYQWRGDKVSYSGLHKWVQKHLGKSNLCEFCHKIYLERRQMDWANKDHLYKRDLNDWIRLCKSCHKKYDLKHNIV